MSHLDEGILHAMLDGEVGSTELKAIEIHLAGCGTCGTRLEEARRFRDESLAMLGALDEQPVLAHFVAAAAPAPAAAAPRRRRPGLAKRLPAWAPGLAWAATIVAAIGLGWSLRVSDLRAPTAGSDAAPVLTAGPPAASPVPSAVAAATPSGPAAASAPPNEPRRDRRPANDQAPTGLAMADTAAPAAAPPVAQPAQNESRGELEARRSALGARLSAKREGELAKKSLLAPAVSAADELASLDRRETSQPSISAAQAIEILGGSIRLVDGLTPVRFELAGDVVRVVYETSFGRLILEQWRAANVVSHRLIAPRAAPADSVSAWAERVR